MKLIDFQMISYSDHIGREIEDFTSCFESGKTHTGAIYGDHGCGDAVGDANCKFRELVLA